MAFHYSESKTNIVEQFFLPIYLYQKGEEEWGFTSKERDVLKESFAVMAELGTLLAPYKEQIKTYYLMGQGLSLLHAVYFQLLSQGKNPETADQVHDYCLTMSADEIRYCLKLLVISEEADQGLDIMELLELAPLKPEEKWYFSQFYRQPIESMARLVALSRELVNLYQPYLEKGLVERRAYEAEFSLETLFENSPTLQQTTYPHQEGKHELFIVSPWLIRVAMYNIDGQSDGKKGVIVSCYIEKVMTARQALDEDAFVTTLKVLSDISRYNVMVALTKPHAKNKLIAEELGITGAAVSFHTQKLLNAQLLLFSQESKTTKYKLNKSLLRDIISKIEADFQLDG